MTCVSMKAWRTELYVDVRAGIGEQVLLGLLEQEVARLDAAASRFRPDSEVALLTRCAGKWVPVSDLMLTLLQRAIAVAAATDGIVHPGLGSLVAGAGYDRWAGQASSVCGAATVLPWESIDIDPEGAARIPRGMVLDLGATAKAWLADRVATAINAATGADVLANMGGDIRCISAGEPWLVWLDADLSNTPPRGIALSDAGVATSGLSRRRWPGGHHIIDPRTGAPAVTPWWSASVVAADAVGANAASTAAVVLGGESPQWLARLGLTAALVDAAGHETLIGNWNGSQVAA